MAKGMLKVYPGCPYLAVGGGETPANPSAVAELAQIPFGTLIGAPLKASIEAQALAAKTTIDFIEKVGFIQPDQNPDNVQDPLTLDETKDVAPTQVRNVVFTYSRTSQDGTEINYSLKVPILTIVPIPYIRLDEVTIDFSAKLQDTVQTNRKDTTKFDASLAAKYSSWWSPISVDFRTSLSLESETTQKSTYIREYLMKIHVRAVQDSMPAGLAKVLEILGTAIKEKPPAA